MCLGFLGDKSSFILPIFICFINFNFNFNINCFYLQLKKITYPVKQPEFAEVYETWHDVACKMNQSIFIAPQIIVNG